MIYQFPELQSKLYPEINSIKTALLNADSADERYKNSQQLMSILDRLTYANPKLSGHILTRSVALSAFDFVITDNENQDQKKAEIAQKKLNKAIRKVLKNFVNLALFGKIAFKLSYKTDNDSVIKPDKIKLLHATETEVIDNEVLLYNYENNKYIRTQIKDDEQHLFLTMTDDRSSVTGGLLRSLVYYETLRHKNILEWNAFIQKAKGVIQAKADNDSKNVAAAALANFIENNYAVTDKDVEFILNEMISSRAADSYISFLDYTDKSSSIAVLGQANTSELPDGGGSRAALQVLNLIRNDILFSDMQNAKEFINDQLLLHYVRMNHDKNADESFLEFDFVLDDLDDVQTNSQVITDALAAGIPLISNEVYKKIGMTKPADDDEIIEVSKNNVLM